MRQIDVIVPVYNTEKTLPRCLDSLLAQTFADFELLLIDDGSTDNSLSVCRAYARKDRRIRVIATAHRGVGAVRNIGLENADSRYIMFCDSDDYVEPAWMETLYRAACAHPKALCNCEYAMTIPAQGVVEPQLLPHLTKSQEIEKKAFFPLLFHGQLMHLWTRIFRTDVIQANGLRFRELQTEGEDMIFICEYLRYCDCFYFVHQCLYYWADNGEGSVTRGFTAYYFDDMKQIYLARKEHIAEEFRQDFYDYSFQRFMRCLEFVWDARNTDSDAVKTDYCQTMFADPVFQETVRHVSEKACPRAKQLVIQTKNYRLYRRFTEHTV